MHLLDGKGLAEQIRAELKQQKTPRAYIPTLAVMIVGDDPASHLYVNMKRRAGEELGLVIRVHAFPAETSTQELIKHIQAWNEDASIHGILVQVPLPKGQDESQIISAMDPRKDVDGFHPFNITELEAGNPSLISPVHEGVLRLINQSPAWVNGSHVSLIGNSAIFTKPLQHLLETAGAIVRVISAQELDTPWLKESDIVVIAIGHAHFLKPEHVRDDAVIIDVGTTREADQKIAGDVDREAFSATDCWITPVPGGVGPMTIALLMRNIILCAEKQEEAKNTQA